MAKYSYNGPVLFWGRYIGDWKGETIAPSECKARSNLTYQYKKTHNLAPSVGIGLPGKLIIIS